MKAFILKLLIAIPLVAVFSCSKPDCQNGGRAVGGDCDCPSNTFGASCATLGPAGISIDTYEIRRFPVFDGFNGASNEDYKLILKIEGYFGSIEKEIEICCKNFAPYIADFASAEIMVDDYPYGSLSSHLSGKGYRFLITEEYWNSTGGYRVHPLDQSLSLEEIGFEEGDRNFIIRLIERDAQSQTPVEVIIRGHYLF